LWANINRTKAKQQKKTAAVGKPLFFCVSLLCVTTVAYIDAAEWRFSIHDIEPVISRNMVPQAKNSASAISVQTKSPDINTSANIATAITKDVAGHNMERASVGYA
jgi:hypothetical protein